MEELEEDGVYFILKSGLSSRMAIDRAQNVHHGEDNDKRSETFNNKVLLLLLFAVFGAKFPLMSGPSCCNHGPMVTTFIFLATALRNILKK